MGNYQTPKPLQTRAERFKQILENSLESIYPEPSADVIKVKSKRPTKAVLHRIERVTLEAHPIEGKNEKVVNARDGRVQVKNTAEWPNSVHGLVTMKFKNSTCWGTGIMIGPNIVLTAGHNLYDYERKIYADLKSMKFLPGMNGNALPFGSVDVKKYFVSPNYIKEEKEDYGVLILESPIGEKTGYFGLVCLESEEIKAKRINVVGYPYDKVVSKPCTYEMWGMQGKISQIDQDKGLMDYLIDTEQGQSGSGVWYQEEEDFYVCGVHVSGTQIVNTATFLTRVMYQQIHEWIQQMRFKDLLRELKDGKKLELRKQGIDMECLHILMKYKFEDLRILDLASNKLEDEGAKILALNTSWINLLQLDLSSNNIDAEGAKAIAQNTSWVNLSQLDLYYNNIGAEGAKGLGQNTSWINLSQLNLYGNNIGAEGAKALGQNTSWINLSKLSLYNNKIGDEGAKGLGQNTSWINLSQLDLYNNNIGDEGAKGLGQNTSWINLSQLYLYYNKIGDEGAKALGQNSSWVNLSQLSLYNNKIGDEGAKGLGQNTSWINLSKLSFYNNKIGDEGAKGLGQNTSWINLSQLDLSSNNIGDEGAKGLGQNTSWINLSQLDLWSHHIGDEGAKGLGQNTSWINLSQLYLYNNKIGDEGAKLLRQNKTWKKHVDIHGIYFS